MLLHTNAPSTVFYVYSYLRISTKLQLLGDGVRRQAEEAKQFAEQQDNWVMVYDFELKDIGKSAFHGRNLDDQAALGQFLKAVQDGKIQQPAVLLVENLDRLSRAKIMSALQLFLGILEAGITICTFQDKMIYNKDDINENFGPLIISITFMARSHNESASKSKRIASRWAEARKTLSKDSYFSKTLYPCWIEVKDDAPIANEKKSKVIQDIFEWVINDRIGFIKIVQRLKDNGVPPINDKSSHWTISMVHRLFDSKRVLGIYEPHSFIDIDGVRQRVPCGDEIHAYPAVIDEATYYQARSIVKKRRNSENKGRTNVRNLFRGILRCGCCGGYYVSSGNRDVSIYRCNDKVNRKNDCQQKSSLHFVKTERALFHLVSLISDDDLHSAQLKSEKREIANEIESLAEQKSECEQRIENLVSLISAGSKTGIQQVVSLEKKIELLESESVILGGRLKRLTNIPVADSLTIINKFSESLYRLSTDQKQRILFNESLKRVVNRIDVCSPENTNERSILKMELVSGIKLKMVLYKKYSGDVYKNGQLISSLEAY